MPIARSSPVDRGSSNRVARVSVLSRRVHRPGRDCRHRLPEQRGGVQHPLPDHCADAKNHCRRSPASGSGNRLLRRAAQLGTEPPVSPALALCRARRRALARWAALDPVPPELLLASQGSVPAIPAPVPRILAEDIRLGEAAVFWTLGNTRQTPRLCPTPRGIEKTRVGGLCQAPVRRTRAGSRLCGPLYPPRGHLQQPPARYGKRSNFLSTNKRQWSSAMNMEVVKIVQHERRR